MLGPARLFTEEMTLAAYASAGAQPASSTPDSIGSSGDRRQILLVIGDSSFPEDCHERM